MWKHARRQFACTNYQQTRNTLNRSNTEARANHASALHDLTNGGGFARRPHEHTETRTLDRTAEDA